MTQTQCYNDSTHEYTCYYVNDLHIKYICVQNRLEQAVQTAVHFF